MAKLTLAQADDWAGIYIDNKLDYEGHDIPASFFMEYINNPDITSAVRRLVDIDWMYEQGHLPINLEDVKFENEVR